MPWHLYDDKNIYIYKTFQVVIHIMQIPWYLQYCHYGCDRKGPLSVKLLMNIMANSCYLTSCLTSDWLFRSIINNLSPAPSMVDAQLPPIMVTQLILYISSCKAMFHLSFEDINHLKDGDPPVTQWCDIC